MSHLLWYFIVQLLISTPDPLSDHIYMCVYIQISIPTYIYIYGEGNGTPLQYSCLANPMDGGAW